MVSHKIQISFVYVFLPTPLQLYFLVFVVLLKLKGLTEIFCMTTNIGEFSTTTKRFLLRRKQAIHYEEKSYTSLLKTIIQDYYSGGMV